MAKKDKAKGPTELLRFQAVVSGISSVEAGHGIDWKIIPDKYATRLMNVVREGADGKGAKKLLKWAARDWNRMDLVFFVLSLLNSIRTKMETGSVHNVHDEGK